MADKAIHREHPPLCYCDRGIGPHVHLGYTDEQGRPVGAVWDNDEKPDAVMVIERRLHALEANVQNIWEHLNGRGTGDR